MVRFFLRSGVVFLYVSTAGSLGIRPETAKGQSQFDIADVRNAWRTRQEDMQSAQFEWKEVRFIGAGTQPSPPRQNRSSKKQSEVMLPESDVTVVREVTLSLFGNMMRYAYEGQVYNPQRRGVRQKKYLSVFDGEESKNFHDDLDWHEGEGYPRSGFVRNRATHYDFDNRYLSAILITYRPCDVNLGGVDLGRYQISPQVGNVDGHTCIIVEPQSLEVTNRVLGEKSYWVDPERDFIVRRIVWARAGQSPMAALTIFYKEHEKFGWYPASWKFVNTGGTVDRIIGQTSADVLECEFNIQIPRSVFQFQFPAGTAVTDNRDGRRYIVLQDGSRREVTRGELARGATYRDLIATESGMAARESSLAQQWNSWLYIGLAVVNLILLSSILAFVIWKNWHR